MPQERGRSTPSNQFFCDLWVVGFLEGPAMADRTLDWRVGSSRFWLAWATRRNDRILAEGHSSKAQQLLAERGVGLSGASNASASGSIVRFAFVCGKPRTCAASTRLLLLTSIARTSVLS